MSDARQVRLHVTFSHAHGLASAEVTAAVPRTDEDRVALGQLIARSQGLLAVNVMSWSVYDR